MSNHYHLVLRIHSELSAQWSNREIIARWTQLYKAPVLIERYQLQPQLSKAELDVVEEIIHCGRQRLSGISWFMRCLNQPVARMAKGEIVDTRHSSSHQNDDILFFVAISASCR